MKNSMNKSVVAVFLLSAGLGASALAQTPPPAAPPPPAAAPAAAPAAPTHVLKHEEEVDARIRSMHDQLKITSQQEPQWNALAQTMRDNAAQSEQAFDDRRQKMATINADDAMKSYAQLAQMHADHMQKLAASFSALYAVLTPEQKATADRLFRNEHKHRHHHHKKHAKQPPNAPAAFAAPPINAAPTGPAPTPSGK